MKHIQTIADVNLRGKRILARVDFNVPMDGSKITDTTRIEAALPTINYLLQQSAKVILLSHLGRPKGKKDPKYSLRPVAQELSRLLHRPVLFLDDCIGDGVQQTIDELDEGSVVLLENLRFYSEETENDEAFAQRLASYGDAYVNDAFASSHRAHASTAGVPKLLPLKVAGFLLQKELEFLETKTANPERPFTVVLGGAKVSDKIGVIDALLNRCDRMIIGGAMAYTFLRAQGFKTGNSLVEEDKISVAEEAIRKATAKGVQLLLPVDSLATRRVDFEEKKVDSPRIFEGNVDDGWQGIDIGPASVTAFRDAILSSKTVLWNGPMGIFEIAEASRGTFAIAKAIAESHALSIVGGGDSIKALHQSGHDQNVTFISTGGGASLEFLEGKELPGIAALNSKNA